jgi:hypothetical protein
MKWNVLQLIDLGMIWRRCWLLNFVNSRTGGDDELVIFINIRL